jgi:NADH-quinone oxidoreductase subunit L
MVEATSLNMARAAWAILFSPLAAACLITFFSLKRAKLASFIALAGILTSLCLTIWLFVVSRHTHGDFSQTFSYPWIYIDPLRIDFGFILDPLSILMALVVTGVGSCIFFYSMGYMKGDGSYPRFFASLSLFAFSMIGIVLSNNFFMLFVFWELVAVSSYLLIGFWFEKPSAADAGNKAFIVNRLADFGFVLGIFYVWMLSGKDVDHRTFMFADLARIFPEAIAQGTINPGMLVIASLLVFCGVVGKSAQFPLYIWLPDAMEGPTPVSALIHAATMVAAGVYLMARTFFLVSASPDALVVISYIGILTAIMAGLLALVQTDIKKILAYSTVSQLGFMVTALGLGSQYVAMYHLTTHAFFKALLFLGAGSMIHGLHTQDIWKMGGLLKKMPITAWTFLIGTLALCGIPPLSGFFSKDEILHLALEHNKFIFGLALFAAALTAFYMTRACWIAILGPRREEKHDKHHGKHDAHASHEAHESPLVMTLPLVVLSVLAIIGGFIGIPQYLMGAHGHESHLNLFVATLSVVAALAGIGLGTKIYANKNLKTDPLISAFGALYQFVVNKYYLDDLFAGLANFFQKGVAKILFWFDQNIVIQGGVNGAAGLTGRVASLVRKAQSGVVQNYATVFGFGIVGIIYYILMRS